MKRRRAVRSVHPVVATPIDGSASLDANIPGVFGLQNIFPVTSSPS